MLRHFRVHNGPFYVSLRQRQSELYIVYILFYFLMNPREPPNLLPLCVEVVVDFLVCDGHHDDEDPQEDDTDQELVHDPHGDHRVLEVLWPLSSGDDALQEVVPWHLGCRVHLQHKSIFNQIEMLDKIPPGGCWVHFKDIICHRAMNGDMRGGVESGESEGLLDLREVLRQ